MNRDKIIEEGKMRGFEIIKQGDNYRIIYEGEPSTKLFNSENDALLKINDSLSRLYSFDDEEQ